MQISNKDSPVALVNGCDPEAVESRAQVNAQGKNNTVLDYPMTTVIGRFMVLGGPVGGLSAVISGVLFLPKNR